MSLNIETSIKNGEELFSQGKVEEAEALFLKLLKEVPSNAEVLNNLGVLCYMSGRRELAESFLLRALETDSGQKDALLNLSLLYQGAHQWEAAAVTLERLLEIEEECIEILNQLAVVYLEAGKRAQAITTLKRSLAANPNQPDINTVLSDLGKYVAPESSGEEVKILHVMILDKFLPSFIDFIDKHFGRRNHKYFFIEQERYDYGLTPEHGAEFLNTIDGIFITLLDYMKEAKKIILHGLWKAEIDILLYFNQELLKKCYWVMWGGDYYFPERHTAIRKQIIGNMGHVINYTIEDYELVKKWYGTNAQHHKCFGYLSNTFKDYSYLISKAESNNGKKIILIGNSAHPANNHFEILDKISTLKNRNIEVICPLSYGDNAYAEKVIQAGNSLFGEKFKPLIAFIPLEEYIKILLKVDIAIFAHKRQQGMGNIRTLLGMGKKVYIRDDITSWHSLKGIKVKVYSFNNENIEFNFPENFQIENVKNMKDNFSCEQLISDWDKIFKN